jgi:hypothetical protein
MTDTSSILATVARQACDDYKTLIRCAVTINAAGLPTAEDTDGAGRDASGLFGSEGDDGRTRTNLGSVLEEEDGGDTTPKPVSDENKSRMRSAAKSMRSAATNQAGLDAADVSATSATTKGGQADVVAGDLTSVLSNSDVKVIEVLNVYKYITPEGLASVEFDGARAKPDELSLLLAAANIGDSAGFFDDEFNMTVLSERLEGPQDIYDTVVDVLCNHMHTLNEENIRLTENCMKTTPEWQDLVAAYSQILECDVWMAIGGGRQIQAHFSMCKRIANYLLNMNQTIQVRKYLRAQDNLSFAAGSAAGIAFGVIEYMGGLVGSIDEMINGKLNALVVQAYVNEHSMMEMNKGESATHFCDRVKALLFDDVVAMSKTSANLGMVVNNLAISGTLDIVKTILAGVRNAPHMSHDIRNVCANYNNNRNHFNLPVNGRDIEDQLDDVLGLRQKLEQAETRELIYNPPRRGGGSKGNKNRSARTLREFAAAITDGSLDESGNEKEGADNEQDGTSEGPSSPETAAIMELKGQVSQLTTAMAALVNAQAKPGGSKPNASTKTPAEKKANRLKSYAPIISNDFKQASFNEEHTCEYCNRKGHKQAKCARFAWDLTHDQMNAHAGAERIEYLTSNGYNNHKPAAGTFKVYPHGNGNGPAAKKKSDDDVIADLEKQLTDLKAKTKGGKNAEKYAALLEAISDWDNGSDSDDE